MNEDIKSLERVIYTLIGENDGLRFLVGLPEKNYKLRGCVLYSNDEPCGEVNDTGESKEPAEKCIILDIRTGKRVG